MNHTEQEYNELRDALQEANNQRLKQGKIWLEENKQLKEELKIHGLHQIDEYVTLKQKLEASYEALQRIRDERNTAWTKLEKIKVKKLDNEQWSQSDIQEWINKFSKNYWSPND